MNELAKLQRFATKPEEALQMALAYGKTILTFMSTEDARRYSARLSRIKGARAKQAFKSLDQSDNMWDEVTWKQEGNTLILYSGAEAADAVGLVSITHHEHAEPPHWAK